jgi:hypothetical protein
MRERGGEEGDEEAARPPDQGLMVPSPLGSDLRKPSEAEMVSPGSSGDLKEQVARRPSAAKLSLSVPSLPRR